VRSGKPVYAPLERFVSTLGIPFLGRVSDSDVYVDAAQAGRGIYDLPADTCAEELREFLPIVRWVQGQPLDEPATSNVVPITSARA
jgi:chromosome partitioning protein